MLNLDLQVPVYHLNHLRQSKSCKGEIFGDLEKMGKDIQETACSVDILVSHTGKAELGRWRVFARISLTKIHVVYGSNLDESIVFLCTTTAKQEILTMKSKTLVKATTSFKWI